MSFRSAMALVGLLVPVGASATTVSFLEQNYYETYSDYVDDPGVGGGIPLGDGGSVSNDNAYVAHRIQIVGPDEGDVIEWETTDPSGNVEEYRVGEYLWDEEVGAYCFVGSLDYCGPSHTTTWTWLWNVLFHETGTYTTNVLLNGSPVLTTTYVVTSGGGGGGGEPPEEDQCLKTSGDGQVEPEGTTLEPFAVTLLDPEGVPLAGAPVTFTIVESPNGAKGETLEAGGVFASEVTATTDGNGVATATLTHGTNKDGDYEVFVTCNNAANLTFQSVAAPYVTGITHLTHFGPRPVVGSLFEGTLEPGAGVFADTIGVLGGLVGDEITVEALIESEYGDLTEVSVVWSADYAKPGAKGKGEVIGGDFLAVWDVWLGGFYAEFPVTFPLPKNKGNRLERPPIDTFGWHDLTLEFSFYEGDDFLGSQTIETQVVLYFPKEGIYPSTLDPLLPNWAFYWRDIPEIQALEDDPFDLQPDRSVLADGLRGPEQLLLEMFASPVYLQGAETGSPDGVAVIFTKENHTHRFGGDLCGQDDQSRAAYQHVPGTSGPFEDKHSDTNFCGSFVSAVDFAETIVHEHVHMTDWYYFWAPEYADKRPPGSEDWTDADFDGYPDDLVPITTMHLFTAQTEVLWYGAGNQGRVDAIAAQDWAYPGPQAL